MGRGTVKVGLCLQKRFNFVGKYKNIRQNMKKLHTKMNRMRYEYELFSKEVPIPGLREITRSANRMLRWSWIICVVAFLALTLYFTCNSVIDFANNPTATRVTFEKNKSYNVPLIYICFDLWKNDQILLEDGLTQNGLHYLNFLLTTIKKRNTTEYDTNRDIYYEGRKDFNMFLTRNNYSIFNILKDYSWTENNVIIPVKSDTYKNVTKVYVAPFRKMCYKFEFAPVQKNKVDKMYTIKLKHPEGSNVTMFLDVEPSAVRKSDTSKFVSNISYEIFIYAQRTISVNTWHKRSCNDEENYDEATCQDNCENNKYMKNNLCPQWVNDSMSWSEIEQVLRCGTHENMTANETARENKMYEKIVEECAKECLPKCNVTSYQTSICHWADEIQPNVITLYFHLEYSKLGIQTMEEIPTFTWVTFISNVGGQLSLWMGFSIVTLVQIAFHFVNNCFRKRKLTMNKTRNISNTSV